MNYKNNFKNEKVVRFNPSQPISRPTPPHSKQKGAAILGTVMVLLVIVSLIGIAASKSTILETRMVFNMQDKQRSSVAADSVTQVAWNKIKTAFDIEAFIKNDTDGYYVLTDAYPIDDGTKSTDSWDSNKKAATWPWNDASKTNSLPVQVGGASNPMKLVATPQYTVGIHKEGFRKGTADYHCIPVSIIGASQGGTLTTRTLVEVKAVPKSGCYKGKIK